MILVLLLTLLNPPMKIDYLNCPPIPPRVGMQTQFGLAGPVAGADGNFVMVAGGANFESGLPWRGGVKSYHDEIFLLEERSDGSLSWKESPMKLPFPMAYPACITMKDGFVSIGGENEHGPLRYVFKFSFKDGSVEIEKLPDLPEEISSAAATISGDRIFVAGGITKTGESSSFYTLSMDFPGDGWKKLPDIPVKMSHSVLVAQRAEDEGAIYLLGGRNKTGELSTFLSSVYKYSPRERQWTLDSEIKADDVPVGISAGTGFAVGRDKIVLFGGDRGFFFNQTERMNLEIAAVQDASGRDSLLKRKDRFLINHPGFSNEILVYNVITKTWSSAGKIPAKSPVTTVVFPWKGKYVIPSGEIRPGVRTDKVLILLATE